MKLRAGDRQQLYAAQRAVNYLRLARAALDFADSPKATEKVRKALKSAEGAVRHAQRRASANNQGE